jgi:hypothetical protein
MGLLVLHTGRLAGCCLLGVFGKCRKATVSFLMSVRLTARNNLASSGRLFIKFAMFAFLEKPVERIQVSLKSNHNIGTVLQRAM